ncbi:hypothetical protein BG006_001798 [Podila minutissima]|uniref:Uncharacterized protein n=1 Tax=Podila minutissima TaxID=64525 RepID=A0A9P5S9W2_9FUNG|nr:hypothetical protein BG006_001798 [Podila minutissima]
MWIPSSTIRCYNHHFQTVVNHNTNSEHHRRLLGSNKIQNLTIVKSDWSTRIMSANVGTITRLHWAGSNVWAESKFEAWEYSILSKMRYLRELELMGWITLREPDFCTLLTEARNLTKLKLRGVNGLNVAHKLSGQLIRLESWEVEVNEMNSAFMLGLIGYLPKLSHLLIDATWVSRTKAREDLEVLVNQVGQFCKELRSIALSTSYRFESKSLAVQDDLIASLAACAASRGLCHFSADLDVVGPKLEVMLVAQKSTLTSLVLRVSEIHSDGRHRSATAKPRVIDTSSGQVVWKSGAAPVIPNLTSFETDLWRQLLALPKLTELQWDSVLHIR